HRELEEEPEGQGQVQDKVDEAAGGDHRLQLRAGKAQEKGKGGGQDQEEGEGRPTGKEEAGQGDHPVDHPGAAPGPVPDQLPDLPEEDGVGADGGQPQGQLELADQGLSRREEDQRAEAGLDGQQLLKEAFPREEGDHDQGEEGAHDDEQPPPGPGHEPLQGGQGRLKLPTAPAPILALVLFLLQLRHRSRLPPATSSSMASKTRSTSSSVLKRWTGSRTASGRGTHRPTTRYRSVRCRAASGAGTPRSLKVTSPAERSASGGVISSTPGRAANPSFSRVAREATRSQTAVAPTWSRMATDARSPSKRGRLMVASSYRRADGLSR